MNESRFYGAWFEGEQANKFMNDQYQYIELVGICRDHIRYTSDTGIYICIYIYTCSSFDFLVKLAMCR